MAINWGLMQGVGQNLGGAIGSLGDLAGISSKARAIAQFNDLAAGKPYQPSEGLLGSVKSLLGFGGQPQQPDTTQSVPAQPAGTVTLGSVGSTPLPNDWQRSMDPLKGTGKQAPIYQADLQPVGAPASTPNWHSMSPQKQAFDYFVGKGYTPAAAAGLVGNFQQESGFSPANIAAVSGGGDGGQSKHLAQWNGDRLQGLYSFAQQNGMDPRQLPTQLAYVDHELKTTEASTGRALQGVTDPTQAAYIAAGYERPQGWSQGGPASAINGWGNRRGAAVSAYKQFAGPGAALPSTDQPFPGDITGSTGGAPATMPAAASPAPGASNVLPFSQVPLASLIQLAGNNALPDAQRAVLGQIIQARMPQAKQYGFIQSPDGTIYRTNPQTGAIEAAAQGEMKPTADMQEYQAAKAQGFTGSLQDWIVGNKKAGATSISIDNSGENAFSKELGTGSAKLFNGMLEGGTAAQADIANIGVLRDALSKSPTGLVGAIQSAAQDWGINIGKNADAVQVAKAAIAKLVPTQRVPGSGTTSDRDLAMFQAALPRLTGTPQGNAIILDTMQAMAEYKQAQADIAGRLATGEFKTPADPTGMRGAIAALRALPNPYDTFKKQAGTVMGNGAGATAAPPVGTIDGGYVFKGGDPADPNNWTKAQ